MVEKGAHGGGSQHRDSNKRPFLCGVVEGFYGRPWTLTQRKHLFSAMEAWQMNSYLYAPKDDCKHRAFWRELYTVEEADHLQSLISAAHECNVDFIYAISPGLDITYSSSKEIATLKRKLDQVSQLGCKSFALLFDDIEAEMSKADKESFQSFAHAQVSVTNEIYEHLGQPKFLFCPTQYCTTRAVPTISTSEYLKTIGDQLAPDIDIMWTGDKVIPKEITVASLQPISAQLKRQPVIWDNEHANDYDPRRIYLGPYSGRSPDLIPKLRGVLTNPNCEYGANYVAIHTLAAWAKCTVDGCSNSLLSAASDSVISADIKLELGGGDDDVVAAAAGCCDESGLPLGGGGGGGGTADLLVSPPPPDELPPHVYHPRLALKAAIKDWLTEFSVARNMWGPITKPQVGMNPTGIIQPSVNTCMTATTTTSSINSLLPSATASENGAAAAAVGGGVGSPLSPPPSAATDSGDKLGSSSSIPNPAEISSSTLMTSSLISDGVSAQGGPSESSVEPNNSTPPPPSSLMTTTTTTLATPVTTSTTTAANGAGTAAAAAVTLLCAPGAATPLVPVMNSLVSSNEVIMERPSLDMSAALTGGTSASSLMSSPCEPAKASPLTMNSIQHHQPQEEPMETNLEHEGSGLGSSPLGLKPHNDVVMESNTNPPTPASIVMQVDTTATANNSLNNSGSSNSGGGMVKSESTTMLCEPPISPEGGEDTNVVTSSSNNITDSITNLQQTVADDDDEELPPVVSTTTTTAVATAVTENSTAAAVMLGNNCVNTGETEEAEFDDPDAIDENDLQLICDLFYLPCEHGPLAVNILTEFYWLKTNAGVILTEKSGAGSGSDSVVVGGADSSAQQLAREEWHTRRLKFNNCVADIKRAFDRLCASVNREVVYNLYTYVWDLVGVLHLLLSYIDWLMLGKFSPNYKQLVIGRHTWFSGIREAFVSGDHEPWVFRGGLTADLQRLMPVDSGNDLFMYMFPDHPTSLIYKIRQYRPADEDAVYRICLQTWEDGMDASDYYSTHPKLVGEKSIGPFLNFYSHLGFVFVGANEEIVGYIFAAPNMKEFYQRLNVAWLPELRTRYAKVEQQHDDGSGEGGELLTPCEATINSLHEGPEPELPTCVESPETWALIRLACLPTVSDNSLAKRSTMLMLACLRTSGVLRVLAEVPRKEKYMQELYSKIGFTAISSLEQDTSENVYLSRSY